MRIQVEPPGRGALDLFELARAVVGREFTEDPVDLKEQHQISNRRRGKVVLGLIAAHVGS